VTLCRKTSLLHHHHLKLYFGPKFATEYKETNFIKDYHAKPSIICKIVEKLTLHYNIQEPKFNKSLFIHSF
jgi:hypothetical protein